MSINRCLLYLGIGAMAGWAIGAVESALIAAFLHLGFESPLLESFRVCGYYAASGALLGLALSLLPLRFLPSRPSGVAGLCFAALFLVTAGTWLQLRALGGKSLLHPLSLAGSLGLLAVCYMLGFGLGRLRAAPAALLVLSIGGHAAVLAATPFGAAGASRAARPAPPPGAPNVLFVLVDTLRADHMSCYGYTEPNTPVADQLAAQGARFAAAYAQASWTRPSVASLFTSLYPASHRSNYLQVKVSDSFTTMAECFRDGGYATAGFSANRNVSPVFGLDQGFDTFWAHAGEANSIFRFTAWYKLRLTLAAKFGLALATSSLEGSDARAVTDRVLDWARQHDGSPYFLYVQYLDPHGPYAPPPDFLREIGLDLDPQEVLSGLPAGMHEMPPYPFAEVPALDATRLQDALRLYDAEIRFCDRELGRLLAGLRARGMLDQSYVVFTSDHGEEFHDHRQFGHGQSLFDELARVPLIVSGPGVAAQVVAQPVELIDLYPTLASLAGLTPPAEIHGRDLSAVLRQDAAGAAAPAPALAQNVKRSPLDALRIGDEKLILIEHDGQQRWLLFDLAADPGETRDLAAERPERLAFLKAELAKAKAKALSYEISTVETVEISGGDQAVLNALGYAGDDQ